MDYPTKLLDPRWQRKRLEIFERDNWRCQKCPPPPFYEERTLHVHHKFYLPRKDPWDHPDSSLITLCSGCHENEHSLAFVKTSLLNALYSMGFTNTALEGLLSVIADSKMPPSVLTDIVAASSDEVFLSEITSITEKYTIKRLESASNFTF